MARDAFPKEVRIENTNRCNADCTICPREKLDRPKGCMDFDLFTRLVDECAVEGTRTLHLHGFGEPLLDERIFDRINYAKSKDIRTVYIVSNASLLTPEKTRLLIESGLDKMKVSFYGVNKKEYETTHRNLTYEKSRANVLELLRMRREMSSSTPKVRMQYIGSPMHMPKFVLQWWPKARISLNKLHNYGRGRSFASPRSEGNSRPCKLLLQSQTQILWNGDVVPCCYDFNGEIVLGNVQEQTIKEIWNGPAYQKLIDAFSSHDISPYAPCLTCSKR